MEIQRRANNEREREEDRLLRSEKALAFSSIHTLSISHPLYFFFFLSFLINFFLLFSHFCREPSTSLASTSNTGSFEFPGSYWLDSILNVFWYTSSFPCYTSGVVCKINNSQESCKSDERISRFRNCNVIKVSRVFAPHVYQIKFIHWWELSNDTKNRYKINLRLSIILNTGWGT